MAISSFRSSHAEAPVLQQAKQTAYSKQNILQFHMLPVLGQGGKAGQAFQTLTNLLERLRCNSLPENTPAS